MNYDVWQPCALIWLSAPCCMGAINHRPPLLCSTLGVSPHVCAHARHSLLSSQVVLGTRLFGGGSAGLYLFNNPLVNNQFLLEGPKLETGPAAVGGAAGAVGGAAAGAG